MKVGKYTKEGEISTFEFMAQHMEQTLEVKNVAKLSLIQDHLLEEGK